MRKSIKRQNLGHPVPTELVQRHLEVIQDNGVGQTLEHKGKLPEGIDDTKRNDGCDGKKVDNDEDDTESHAKEQDAEAW